MWLVPLFAPLLLTLYSFSLLSSFFLYFALLFLFFRSQFLCLWCCTRPALISRGNYSSPSSLLSPPSSLLPPPSFLLLFFPFVLFWMKSIQHVNKYMFSPLLSFPLPLPFSLLSPFLSPLSLSPLFSLSFSIVFILNSPLSFRTLKGTTWDHPRHTARRRWPEAQVTCYCLAWICNLM